MAVFLGVNADQIKLDEQNPDVLKKTIEAICDSDDDPLLKNHLGFIGVNNIVNGLRDNIIREGNPKLIILSEFSEQLGSFRKRIAESLNKFLGKKVCFTGDLSMKISFDSKKDIKILCSKCAKDNDIKDPFVPPEQIKEVCIKASDDMMVYHCNEHQLNTEVFFINKITYF